jgi:beta-lactam-binding protein with PASTA domain
VVPIEEEGGVVTQKPRSISIPAVRQLLLSAFTAETLPRFCRDRPTFQPVLVRFGPRHGLDDMVEEVIDYCQTQLLWDELLSEVQQANPRQYAQFEDQLYGKAAATGAPAHAPARVRSKWPWEPPRPSWFWPAVGGVVVALVVILVLIAWPPDPGRYATPTAAPATKAPTQPPSPEPTDELVRVPELRGELCRRVGGELDDADLRLDGEPSWQADSEVPYEQVIQTEPPADTEVERDSAVQVVCSLGPERSVPNLVGWSERDAVQELENCNQEPCFETRLEYEKTRALEEGYVLRTDPLAGEVVEPGSVVTLCLSLPPDKVVVPGLTNMTLEDASARLVESELELGAVITETNPGIESGRVIRTDPASGEEVDTGIEVDLVVSEGPAQVEIPELYGLSWEDAKEELDGLDLQAVRGRLQYDDDVPLGNVISSNPIAGTSVEAGVEIELNLSMGLNPAGDADGDGMPNLWEANNGLDLRVHDSHEDADADGLSNGQEFQLQTDPQQADFPSIRVALRYRGERLSSVTSASPSIEVWLGTPGHLVRQELPTVYDIKLGEVTVYNAPAGEFVILVKVDEDHNGYPRAGDLRSEWDAFLASDQDTVRGDIELDTIVHLIEPVDNAFAIPRHDKQTFDLYERDELVFRWDSVPGATEYLVRIWEWQYEPVKKQLGEVVNYRTDQTNYRADLPSSSAGRFYSFKVHAYDRGAQPESAYLGGLYIEYSCSPGTEEAGYEFRVR